MSLDPGSPRRLRRHRPAAGASPGGSRPVLRPASRRNRMPPLATPRPRAAVCRRQPRTTERKNRAEGGDSRCSSGASANRVLSAASVSPNAPCARSGPDPLTPSCRLPESLGSRREGTRCITTPCRTLVYVCRVFTTFYPYETHAMRYERVSKVMHLTVRLQDTRSGLTIDDMETELNVSRRTPERLLVMRSSRTPDRWRRWRRARGGNTGNFGPTRCVS